MTLVQIAFYFFAAITAAAALVILLTRQVLYAAYALLLALLGIAALYVLAGADFIAVTQIMVYVGGILVLLIFGVMLTNRQQDVMITGPINRVAGLVVGCALFLVMLYTIRAAAFEESSWIKQSIESGTLLHTSTVPGIGIQLMTYFVLPFEVAGILLLVALMGAAHLAGRSK
jgi:NADH:ubiquinone oxidoreductase subunit 6 (subunit J)